MSAYRRSAPAYRCAYDTIIYRTPPRVEKTGHSGMTYSSSSDTAAFALHGMLAEKKKKKNPRLFRVRMVAPDICFTRSPTRAADVEHRIYATALRGTDGRLAHR